LYNYLSSQLKNGAIFLIKFDDDKSIFVYNSHCRFNGNNYNPKITFNYNSQEMAPFFILAQDASVGALSCLLTSEKNKQAIIASQAIPNLVQMVDEGTSFGR